MTKKNPLLPKVQKQSKFKKFWAGYLDVVIKGIILLFFLAIPIYFVLVSWLGLHFLIFFIVYVMIVYLLTPIINKVDIGNKALSYYEGWGKK